MNKNIRVCVTGAGSGVGQGIIKSLQKSELNLTIIAADISPFHAGLYVTDENMQIPKMEDDGSLVEIIDLLKSKKIDVLMIGSEFELEFFCENKEAIEKETSCHIVVHDLSVIEMGHDKFKTYEFLKANDLPFANSFSPDNLETALKNAKELGYPLVLKPRKGTSNRDVYIVDSKEKLERYFPRVSMPMIQELINSPANTLQNEYTCSIFKTVKGEVIGPFTAKRTLRSGNSWVVEVKQFDEIKDDLISLGKKLNFVGSINIQLMINKENKPVPFEINPRFSGTTAVRAYFGFNEPDMYLRNVLLKQELDSNLSFSSGMAFRYLEEIFIDGVSESDLTENQSFIGKKDPSWF